MSFDDLGPLLSLPWSKRASSQNSGFLSFLNALKAIMIPSSIPMKSILVLKVVAIPNSSSMKAII